MVSPHWKRSNPPNKAPDLVDSSSVLALNNSFNSNRRMQKKYNKNNTNSEEKKKITTRTHTHTHNHNHTHTGAEAQVSAAPHAHQHNGTYAPSKCDLNRFQDNCKPVDIAFCILHSALSFQASSHFAELRGGVCVGRASQKQQR